MTRASIYDRAEITREFPSDKEAAEWALKWERAWPVHLYEGTVEFTPKPTGKGIVVTASRLIFVRG